MNLSELFPVCIYTNMDYRSDRNEQVKKEIAKLGIEPLRAPGVVYTGTNNKQWNGWIGCGLTHLNILKMALKMGNNVLIFEDDLQLINNYNKILDNAINSLDGLDWDMFYLGANICKPIQQVTNHLGKLSHAQATHAYGVNKNFIGKLIDIIEPEIYTKIIDVMYAEKVVPQNLCYISIPMVAIQRSDFSDIESGYMNYSWMEERFFRNLILKGQ